MVTKSSSLIQLEQSEQFRRNLSEYIIFNLRVPIFSRFENINRISSAQLDVAIQENEVKRVSQKVEKKVQEAWLDMHTAHQKYWAVYKQFKAMESQNQYATQAYAAGVINFTEYNYINNLFNNTQLMLAQAKYDYLYQKQLVEFYKGQGYCQK
jgi:outer membrane protein